MIIDSHVHVWALDDRHQPASDARIPHPREAAPVEWLLEDMQRVGIDRCVLVQSSAFSWDNSYVLECVERFPKLFRAIGLVDPLGEDPAGQLSLWMRRGLVGVRLHPVFYPHEPVWIDTPRHERLWAAAADTGAILQYHMLPAHAAPLARMVERRPDVKVLVDHLGKPDVTEAPPYPGYAGVLALAAYPNVWIKLGDYQLASRQSYPWPDTFPFVEALVRAFGPDRIVWGTGFPGRARLVPVEQALAYVQRDLPGLSADDRSRILGSTPRELYGFD